MSDLIAFLKTRLDEDEAGHWAVHDVTKCDALLYEDLPAAAPLPDAGACECGYPARVIREVAAGRAIIQLHKAEPGQHPDFCGHDLHELPCPTLRHAAAIYSNYPDYQQEWAPAT